MTTQNTTCETEVKLLSDQQLIDILRSGLVVTGQKACGKSNAVKVVTNELLRRGFFQVKVFDSALNWLFTFDRLPYQLITQPYRYENKPNMIYDLTLLDDPETYNHFIQSIIREDFYNKAKKKLLDDGTQQTWTLYVIEEAQIIIGSSALRGKQNRFWLKAISIGRNFNMSFIFITQRLSDVSSKAVERSGGYLFGKMLGDNDLRKLRHIAGKEIAWTIKDLAVGSFYYWNGERSLIKFPKFNGDKAEQHVIPKPKKPKGFWSTLFNGGTSETSEECIFCGKALSESEANAGEGVCSDCSMFDETVTDEDY